MSKIKDRVERLEAGNGTEDERRAQIERDADAFTRWIEEQAKKPRPVLTPQEAAQGRVQLDAFFATFKADCEARGIL